MSSILVLERESRHLERIHDALTAEGYRVKAVVDHAEALAAAASEAPSLLLLDADAPGAESLARSFSRSAGGPGVIALVAGGAAVGPPPLGADDQVAKPFSDGELRQAVLRVASLGRAAAPPPAATPLDQRLTSQDIFGDMLEEVESELAAGAPSAAPAAAPPRPKPRPAVPPSRASDDVESKLEQTLSGVLGSLEAKPRPAPPPKKPADPTDAELDALIGKTLSSLDLGPRRPAAPKPAAPPPAAPPPPAAAAPPPAAPPPATPAAAASAASNQPAPAARKERTGSFEVDRMAELEALARPRRSIEATKTGTGAAPAAAAPVAPAARPPAPPPAPAAPAASSPPAITPLPPPTEPRRVTDDALATQRVPVYRPADEKRFGQYTLLERIAVGGMAEVWKARMTGVEGFQKTVAIKRILQHMTHNADFVGMFIDEAKLAAQLSHPNIIHIYDLGKIGQDYYIAMEFVEGMDLRTLLNAAARWSRPLPLGLALLVGSRLASALDHAHRKRDFEGRELGLVHRDVSPQNVLITYEGDIKLCDFGIAKAVSKASQTQMGALKGKLQYMSPEQAWGRTVDGRSDIFSLGCLLFEMLTGERLFAGTSEMSVLEAVREGRIKPPRAVAPAVPERVDAIVLKALAVAPEDRYQTAGELQAEIDEVLYSLRPAPGHADLAAYMHQIQAAERDGVAPPATLAAPAPPAPAAIAPPASAATPPAEPAQVTPAAPASPAPPAITAERLPEAPVLPFPLPEPAPPAPPDPAVTEPEPVVEALAPVSEVRIEEGGRRSVGLLAAAIGGLIVLGTLAWFLFGRSRADAPADQPPAAEAPASPVPPPAAPAASTPTAETAPAEPGAAAPNAPNVAAIVDQEVARREQELRRQLEEQQRKLERELAQAKAASAPAPAPAAAVPAPSKPPEPAPVPQAAAPEPEPARVAPEPAPEPERPVEQPATRQEEPPPVPAAPRVREGELVQPGAGVRPPSLVSLPKPQYPPVAKKLQVEGVPVVAVLVDENGRVLEAKLEVPIKQNVGINEAALSAARAARYNPATKDGVRVKMWTRLRIPFKL